MENDKEIQEQTNQEQIKQEEVNQTEQETEVYEDPQKLAKEELNNEAGIEFYQSLEKEDILAMNLFLIKHDSSSYVKRAFLLFVGALFIVMPIINQARYYMIALGAILVIYSTVLYTLLRVAYLKSRISKNPPEPLEINVKIGSKHIRYQLVEETDSPIVSFEHIYKVVKNKEYLYLFINRYSIIVLKLDSIEEKDEVIKMMKERYLSRKAYFENK